MKVKKSPKKVTSPQVTKKNKPSFKCDHFGVTEVFTLGKSKWFAGGYFEAEEEAHNFDLLICLNGKRIHYPVTCNDKALDMLSAEQYKFLLKGDIPTIVIDWEDFNAPNIPKGVWEDLIRLSREQSLRILVHCHGGHGRTGTALSAIAYLARLSSRPVTFIRKMYCAKAIESEKQISYIRGLGAQVSEKPSTDYGGYGGYTHSATGTLDEWSNPDGAELPCDHQTCPITRCIEKDEDKKSKNKFKSGDKCAVKGCNQMLYLEDSLESGVCYTCQRAGADASITLSAAIEELRDSNEGKWSEEVDEKGIPTGMWKREE